MFIDCLSLYDSDLNFLTEEYPFTNTERHDINTVLSHHCLMTMLLQLIQNQNITTRSELKNHQKNQGYNILQTYKKYY